MVWFTGIPVLVSHEDSREDTTDEKCHLCHLRVSATAADTLVSIYCLVTKRLAGAESNMQLGHWRLFL